MPAAPAPKSCVACGRTITWRKKWERDWDAVKYCSSTCRRRGRRPDDEALEAAILELLDQRARTATICPSEAARLVAGRNGATGEEWRDLMEPARAAARRLVVDGSVEIVQRSQVVDPSTAKGPIRIRRRRRLARSSTSSGSSALRHVQQTRPMTERTVITVLEPHDEYPHEPDAADNYNESMYLNAFDLEREVGGWFRLGNRVNEGYAEMTVCVYLPGGRVGFMYQRPTIDTNDAMDAGGLRIEVVTPFEELRITYDGNLCVLDDPLQMADPRQAFRDNPHVPCTVDLTVRGMSPMYGGKPQYDDGTELETDPEKSFAKAHYEQHTTVTGTIVVGDEAVTIDGYGLRDKSWGPRYWQAISWYRWLPIMLGPHLAMMLSVIDGGPDRPPRQGGMVYSDGRYRKLTEVDIDSDFDEHGNQTAMRCRAVTEDGETYEVTGEVISLIPLRNRRANPDGEFMTTRITEAMTRYQCGDLTGVGMSEYLDQVVDGRPVGPDVPREDA